MLAAHIEDEILRVLSGLEVFYVGGCVRDMILNEDPNDYDFVVVGSNPRDMIDRGFHVHGLEHSVFVHKKNKRLMGFEFSLARAEKKVGEGHQGFKFHFQDVSLEEDLIRRDFSCNAMAIPVGGHLKDLVDPHGGQQDIWNEELRHVGEAFSEDPLRVLRLARFAARFGWSVSETTMGLCSEMVHRGDLDSLTDERVGMEVMKALHTREPQRFLQVLDQCGALLQVLPELDLYGIPQPEEHHPEVDTGKHLEMALQEGAKLCEGMTHRNYTHIMWGILVHDLGKQLTEDHILPQHLGHEKAGVKVAQELARRIKLPKTYEEFGMLVAECHTSVHRSLDMRSGRVVKFLQKADTRRNFEQNIQWLVVAAEADARGREGLQSRDYPQADFVLGAAEAYSEVKPRDEIIEEIKEAVSGKEKAALGEKLRACQYQDRAEAIAAYKRYQQMMDAVIGD